MDIKIATYNILHGYNKEKVLENIRALVSKGADVICIQEAEIPLEGGFHLVGRLNIFKENFRVASLLCFGIHQS
jgi:endonuclease/exonuclease/phosphatase family metal-dependent hydrolase